MKDFFEEYCQFGEDYLIAKRGLRKIYIEKYAKEAGIKYPLSARDFNKRLRDKGIGERTMRVDSVNRNCWIGIKGKHDDSDLVKHNSNNKCLY